jgi:crotonobetainyl-CoA:carnitine CoA-transferase CaiB-like acyl-CoA transferase
MLVSYPHPAFGQVETMALPLKISGFSPEYRAGPSLDADRHSILATLGYAADEIARLTNAGAFGSGVSGNGQE